MGESGDMPSEDDKGLLDKNKKRKLKTRAQLEALENFYFEHKYPTESKKLLVAERIGLTEKQISSWFCHRRLKDKKILNGEVHVNGKQDRLSGILQDLGSGPRQDSCGSTKESDDGNQRPIEVQSRRLNGQEAHLTYERNQYTNNHSRMDDDTSSGSSSSPHTMHMVGSRLSTQYVANNVNGGKPRSGPSGYLKVKARVENVAITAVKSQLGPLHREDGPSLGIEFDPLPPGAFQSNMHEEPVQEMSGYDERNYNERSLIFDDGGFRVGALSPPQHFEPLGVEVSPEHAEPWSIHERRSKVGRGYHLHSSNSDMAIEGQGNDDFEYQGLFRETEKVNDLFGAHRTFDDEHDAIQRNISPYNQIHRANDEYPPYVGEVLQEGVPQQMNQFTRSAAQHHLLCSEDDEDADTTSSEDQEAEV